MDIYDRCIRYIYELDYRQGHESKSLRVWIAMIRVVDENNKFDARNENVYLNMFIEWNVNFIERHSSKNGGRPW